MVVAHILEANFPPTDSFEFEYQLGHQGVSGRRSDDAQ
jgi:hypothetical protein